VAKTYQRTFDRLLIASKTCFGLYKDEECQIDYALRVGEVDGRGQEFIREFGDELDRLVELTV
jgi:hypothetical protein